MYSNIKASSPRPPALKYTCTLLRFSLGLIDQEELARFPMSTIPGALVGNARVLLMSISCCCQLCDCHMLTLHHLVPPSLLQDVGNRCKMLIYPLSSFEKLRHLRIRGTSPSLLLLPKKGVSSPTVPAPLQSVNRIMFL